MTYTYFDIETIPDQSDDALSKAIDSVKVPANYKNEETIEKYKIENAMEALNKTALDGFKGHVCCIATNYKSYMARDLKDEKDIISEFFNELNGNTLVGHNIIGFDIPFLIKRSLCLNIKLPVEYYLPRNIKPWDTSVFDTMLQFGRDWIGLNALCNAIGIQGKKDIDGSMVKKLWEEKKFDVIEEYCKDDVELVKQVHERFLSVGW